MTVPSNVSDVEYDCDGLTDTFPTTFFFLANSEVVVKLTDPPAALTTLTEGVDYTLTGAGNPAGGTVVCTAVPAADATLVIERTVPFTQAKDFTTQGAFSPAVHEEGMDELVFQTQQLDRRLKAVEGAGAAGDIVAGDGLTSSGLAPMTLAVGEGLGITVSADAVAFDAADAAGAGLVASAASVLAVGAGDGITVSANAVAASFAATTQNINGAAGAVGTAVAAAREDHTHQVLTAAPVSVGTANAVGAGPTLAMSNHVHDHGAQTTGTHHAVANSTTNGFMSAADKTKLDSFSTGSVLSGSVKTTDAVATVVLEWTPTNETVEEVLLQVSGSQNVSANGGGYTRSFCVKRRDGTTAQVGATTDLGTHESTAGWDVTVNISSPKVQVLVTGAAATTVWWDATAQRRISDDA